MNKLDLTGTWEFTIDWQGPNIKKVPPGLFCHSQWLKAQVPGTVHTDLLENNKIKDPFYRNHELQARWISEVGWIYRKQFKISREVLSHPAIFLVAEGLDTFATIFLNGQKVGYTENMFIVHRLDIKKFLVAGKNEILIQFDSPIVRAKDLEEKYGQLNYSQDSYLVYTRKAQYSFGWDWAPKLPTTGIWRPIYFETYQTMRIHDIFVKTHLHNDLNQAEVKVYIEIERFCSAKNSFTAKVELDGIKKVVPIKGDMATVSFRLTNPRLWWPSGLGESHLYKLEVQILFNDQIEEQKEVQIGLRKVELIQENDAWGKSFLFKINNIPVFCKGANWIPADMFIPRISHDKYQKYLELVKNANMNMLRTWGGGIYEDEIFYHLCDQLGLMVWQDFMFACGNYPEHEEFVKNISQEVEFILKRLRNHPCIVLWCGNNENECHWINTTDKSLTEMPGFKLFHQIIPEICLKQDPARPYWPSSPFGGQKPNAQDEGDRHQWHIWSGWEDFTTVCNDSARFISEFGFQAPANISTLEHVTEPEDRWPQSEIMEFHNKQIEGTERLFRFLAAHVKIPTSFEDFIYKAQVVQGEALKHCIEHWRHNKFRTAGTLIWQLNDCWPVTSWSLIDSDLRPKAAYFYVKRAFAPLLVFFCQKDDIIEVWIVNDTLKEISGILKILGQDFYGGIFFSKQLDLKIRPNSALLTYQIHTMDLELDETTSYLKAELWIGGKIISANRYFFRRLKHLKLSKPIIQKSVEKIKKGHIFLKLSTTHFAKSVCIKSNYISEIEDNYFDLDPKAEKTVKLSLYKEKEPIPANISVYSL